MAKQKLSVKAHPGKTCPREGGGVPIDDGIGPDDKARDNGGFAKVANTPYYRACINDGSLILKGAKTDKKK